MRQSNEQNLCVFKKLEWSELRMVLNDKLDHILFVTPPLFMVGVITLYFGRLITGQMLGELILGSALTWFICILLIGLWRD